MIKGEYDNKENPVMRDWIRQLMALTMLPAFAIPLAWTWLKDPPSSGSPATDGKTRSLSNYYERTWINGDFPFRCGRTTTMWDHEQRTLQKDGTTASTRILAFLIHHYECSCIGFKNANMVSSAVASSSLPVGRPKLGRWPMSSWITATGLLRSTTVWRLDKSSQSSPRCILWNSVRQ